MKWAYGVTTHVSRRTTLLPPTLRSLKEAGFEAPRLFVDGERDPGCYSHFGLETTVRYPEVRTYGNWVLSMWELYLREPTAQRYAVFQDDMVTYRNLRGYLEQCKYPEFGYLNLYTFPENEEHLRKSGCIGWCQSNQKGRGAVALVFSRKAVTALLSQHHMVDRVQDVHRGWRVVDGGIVEAMMLAGYKEYVHTPSLVQHEGLHSSMGNQPHQKAISFAGVGFDAMELVKCLRVQ